jgi:hypothetical protein
MPCSPTPAGPRSSATSHQDIAFRHWNSVDSYFALFRGSITRPADSLCTLRRMGCPTTTQHSVPAAGTLGRAGLLTCRVPSKGFQNNRFFPPFSGVAWRTPNQKSHRRVAEDAEKSFSYLAVRDRQTKTSLFARTCICCGPASMKRSLNLFPKGESL